MYVYMYGYYMHPCLLVVEVFKCGVRAVTD